MLLRMAADQERADRIRALKLERPDLTWRRIAEYVGVTERSATDWQKKGGIDYDNAKKLAELFQVDLDYIWRGLPESERAPSPFAGQDALADRIDQLLEGQAELQRRLDAASAEREQHAAEIQKLLKRQDGILKNIEDSITAEKVAKAESEDARTRLLQAAEAASRIYADAARRLEATHDRQAT